MPHYLMIFDEDDYGDLIHGDDPASAVEAHYDEMNAYCSADLDEESRFSVTVHAIRDEDAEAVEEEVDDLSAGDYLDYVADLQASGRSTSFEVVHVLMLRDGSVEVSRPEGGADLFDRLDEGGRGLVDLTSIREATEAQAN